MVPNFRLSFCSIIRPRTRQNSSMGHASSQGMSTLALADVYPVRLSVGYECTFRNAYSISPSDSSLSLSFPSSTSPLLRSAAKWHLSPCAHISRVSESHVPNSHICHNTPAKRCRGWFLWQPRTLLDPLDSFEFIFGRDSYVPEALQRRS